MVEQALVIRVFFGARRNRLLGAAASRKPPRADSRSSKNDTISDIAGRLDFSTPNYWSLRAAARSGCSPVSHEADSPHAALPRSLVPPRLPPIESSFCRTRLPPRRPESQLGATASPRLPRAVSPEARSPAPRAFRWSAVRSRGRSPAWRRCRCRSPLYRAGSGR